MTPRLLETPALETERLSLRAFTMRADCLGCTLDTEASLSDLPDRDGILVCRHPDPMPEAI